MRLLEKNPKNVKKFQMGGPAPEAAPEEASAPVEGGEAQDPMAQILQVAAQAVQTQNCEAAMAVCQALVQIAQGGAQGGAPAEEPTFARNGARLTRVR